MRSQVIFDLSRQCVLIFLFVLPAAESGLVVRELTGKCLLGCFQPRRFPIYASFCKVWICLVLFRKYFFLNCFRVALRMAGLRRDESENEGTQAKSACADCFV